MCCDLEKYIVEYADLMPEFITFHLEATDKVNEMIDMIHSYGIKCGISIKPNTSVKELLPYLDNRFILLKNHSLKFLNPFIKSSDSLIGEIIPLDKIY